MAILQEEADRETGIVSYLLEGVHKAPQFFLVLIHKYCGRSVPEKLFTRHMIQTQGQLA